MMRKRFNITGDCKPDRHYMVNIDSRLAEIKAMVDEGDYFTINRARQYGKTTTLTALGYYLEKAYVVVSLDFQMMSQSDFADERSFVEAFAREVLDNIPETADIPETISDQLRKFADGEEESARLKQAFLFRYLSEWCGQSEKPIVLIIDEVDSATNNQVFMDFLGQLRGYYLKRNKRPTFQSVILAGVYDVKNMKRKLRPEDEHRNNSPWNIAVDFCIDMSFSARDIAGMLEEYEADYNTGMDIQAMSELIYDYTSGYPFLVSRLCKLMDERIAGSEGFPNRKAAWTKEGFLEAVKCLLIEKNTLFESLASKLYNYPELKELIYAMLMRGEKVTYNPDNSAIDMASMFGFVKSRKGVMVIANRLFETRIYNLLLSEEELNSKTCSAGEEKPGKTKAPAPSSYV
ncbi:MAG: AAA-like domain-containing protein [Lachnospiraceae bacterium]